MIYKIDRESNKKNTISNTNKGLQVQKSYEIPYFIRTSSVYSLWFLIFTNLNTPHPLINSIYVKKETLSKFFINSHRFIMVTTIFRIKSDFYCLNNYIWIVLFWEMVSFRTKNPSFKSNVLQKFLVQLLVVGELLCPNKKQSYTDIVIHDFVIFGKFHSNFYIRVLRHLY